MTDTVPQERLVEILAAAEKAPTRGPWQVKTREEWDGGFDFFEGPNGAFCFPVDLEPEDAAHVANCDPQTITAIIKEVLALRTDTAALRAQVVEASRLEETLVWEDDRQAKIHELLETIREQIRVEVAPQGAGMMDWKVSDFDLCHCGDYRKDHKDGTGACVFNHTPGNVHGSAKCMQFRISREAAEIPPPYRVAISKAEGRQP